MSQYNTCFLSSSLSAFNITYISWHTRVVFRYVLEALLASNTIFSYLFIFLLLLTYSIYSAGPRPGEPTRGSFHQWQTSAQPHPTQDRRDGPPRHQAVRHLQTAAGLTRLRVQNPVPVPGDGLHQTRRHRRQQTQGMEPVKSGGTTLICYWMFQGNFPPGCSVLHRPAAVWDMVNKSLISKCVVPQGPRRSE